MTSYEKQKSNYIAKHGVEAWREQGRRHAKAFRQANPERWAEVAREWRKANPERWAEINAAGQKKWRKTHPEQAKEVNRIQSRRRYARLKEQKQNGNITSKSE